MNSSLKNSVAPISWERLLTSSVYPTTTVGVPMRLISGFRYSATAESTRIGMPLFIGNVMYARIRYRQNQRNNRGATQQIVGRERRELLLNLIGAAMLD